MELPLNITFSVLAEIEASDFFDDENMNRKYCKEHSVSDGTSEFILHSYSGIMVHVSEEMRAYGCTNSFIEAYLQAAAMGVERVLFYVE